MDATKKRRWCQFNLNKLIALTVTGPPLLAGGVYLLGLTDAPPLAVVFAVIQVVFWLVVLACIVRNATNRRGQAIEPKQPSA